VELIGGEELYRPVCRACFVDSQKDAAKSKQEGCGGVSCESDVKNKESMPTPPTVCPSPTGGEENQEAPVAAKKQKEEDDAQTAGSGGIGGLSVASLDALDKSNEGQTTEGRANAKKSRKKLNRETTVLSCSSAASAASQASRIVAFGDMGAPQEDETHPNCFCPTQKTVTRLDAEKTDHTGQATFKVHNLGDVDEPVLFENEDEQAGTTQIDTKATLPSL
jgi:hypothetical protein